MRDAAEATGLSPNSSAAWYALHVKPHTERRVHDHLSAKPIPTFLPLIETIHASRNRTVAALEPLFPGYLFIHLDRLEQDPRWYDVRWTPGVRCILGTDGVPTPIPDTVMTTIRERVSEDGFVRRSTPFSPHSRVRFQRGVLAGLEAVFEGSLSRAGRVRVLMTLLGQQTGVEVDAIDLECA